MNIPTRAQCYLLWDKYQLPELKRRHSELVARVAEYISDRLSVVGCLLDVDLVIAAALLHDIDKAVEKLPGEKHPDTAVRILTDEGFTEIALLVKTHPLHVILDNRIKPKTLEEKVLYLSDKMVKYDVIGVDARFKLWNNEHLGKVAQGELNASYPLVKKLESELFELAKIDLHDIMEFILLS
jgi:putative nucleotidyltransferase with HDIG domain